MLNQLTLSTILPCLVMQKKKNEKTRSISRSINFNVSLRKNEDRYFYQISQVSYKNLANKEFCIILVGNIENKCLIQARIQFNICYIKTIKL